MMLSTVEIIHTIYQVTLEKHFPLDKKEGGTKEEERKRVGEREGRRMGGKRS